MAEERPIPEGLFQELGRVTYSWSHVEMLAASFTANLLGLSHDLGIAVTAGDMISRTLQRLRAIARIQLDDDDHAVVEAWATTALQLSERRNGIVHSSWIQSTDEEAEVYVSRARVAKGIASRATTATSTQEVRALADAIDDLLSEPTTAVFEVLPFGPVGD